MIGQDQIIEPPINAAILSQIRDPQKRNWQVKVKHVHREGNFCADWLAKYSVEGGIMRSLLGFESMIILFF